uniref:SJCHGC09371 protein n=1 Tax=Schistosoma japonicum TaxID=6182 RepID=Q5DGC8_SCHJA|nr:SJCHGC09371 protein [Schistosoma japonicum]
MAEYVVRNGLEFEELVIRQKTKDPRFAFLKSDHPLHSYYMARRKELDPDDSLTKAADSNFINIPYPKSPKIRSSKKLDSVDKPEAVFPDNKSKNDPLKKPQSLDSDKAKKVDLETHNSERQKSISFRLSRPIPPKSQSTQNTEAPTEEIMDIIEAAAQEYSESISKSSRRSDEQRTESKIHSKGDIHRKSQKRKSRSPNMNIIPGIPSPSSSSSFESSPLQGESPYSYTHVVVMLRIPIPSVHRLQIQLRDIGKMNEDNYVSLFFHHVRSITSPFDNDLSSVESTSNLNAHLTPNWPLCALEDLLDIHEPTSLLDFSADGYQVAMPTAKEERLREERRKKAAQLVTQLKLTNSIAKANVNTCSATSKPSTVTISSSTADRYRSSPPPAPDSVPAAVAHAVVANMKRRREALEIENKARRKRHRSPPAAYALTRNRMFDRSPRRSPTPKCDRESLRDWDDHHFKSKKKHHKKSCY